MTDAASNWKKLFGLAMPAIDYVFQKPKSDDTPDWTFGGGTALMLQIDHRTSYDIDIFVHGARLKRFTPAVNPAAARISKHYQWPGHYLKFELPDGEIDFISARLQTDPGFKWATIEARVVAIETPEEIIVKKIRFRSESFTARDAFDLAAVAATHPRLVDTLAAEVGDALPRTREALRIIAARDWATQSKAIMTTSKTADMLPHAIDIARRVVDLSLWQFENGRTRSTSAGPAASPISLPPKKDTQQER